MINFEAKLMGLTLYIDEQYEGIANKFCNHGQVKRKGHKLNTWFEGFIYTALIGINIDSRIEYKKSKEKYRRWDSFIDQLGFVFMKALSKDDVRNELKIFDYKQIEFDYEGVEDFIIKTSTIIGEYSNGGLKYLQEEYSKDNSLFESLYALEKIYEATIPEIDEKELLENEEEERTTSLIHGGESPEVEFKSTLRVNLHTKKHDDAMVHACMKTLAAFMNSKGGTLLIGVEDNKNVLGLDTDFKLFKQKQEIDQFQTYLDDKLSNTFPAFCFSLLDRQFVDIDNKKIYKILVKKSSKPCYYKDSTFYIRRSASTIQLEGPAQLDYINEHFKK